jgi:hypothetical protein
MGLMASRLSSQVLRAAQELKAIIESKQGNAAELAYTKLTIAEQIVEKATKECYVQGGGASALAMATPLAMVITLVAIYVCNRPSLFLLVYLLRAQFKSRCKVLSSLPPAVPRACLAFGCAFGWHIGFHASGIHILLHYEFFDRQIDALRFFLPLHSCISHSRPACSPRCNVACLAQVPDMAQLFMAECQVLCPYTIPMFVDPTAAASAEEYKLKIGCAYAHRLVDLV